VAAKAKDSRSAKRHSTVNASRPPPAAMHFALNIG